MSSQPEANLIYSDSGAVDGNGKERRNRGGSLLGMHSVNVEIILGFNGEFVVEEGGAVNDTTGLDA